jgi:hypothetical protein
VAKLALKMIKHGSEVDCAWLWLLPASQHMSSVAVFELLQAAVSRGSGAADYVAGICELPAAKQISSDSLRQLLLAARKQHVSTRFAMPIAQLASKHASGKSFLRRSLGAISL